MKFLQENNLPNLSGRTVFTRLFLHKLVGQLLATGVTVRENWGPEVLQCAYKITKSHYCLAILLCTGNLSFCSTPLPLQYNNIQVSF